MGEPIVDNAKKDTRVPESIKSVEDIKPYVAKCIAAMVDESNYDVEINGFKGIGDLCSIADKTLAEMGFGEEAVRWMTHPFHWLFYNDSGIVRMNHFNQPQNGMNWLWVLDKAKTTSESVDSLTKRFMDKYGEVFYSKIQCIRKNPDYCKN